MKYLVFVLLAFFVLFFPLLSKSNSINILYDQPKFSFINSKDFYETYYNDRNTVIVDLRDYHKYRKNHVDKAISFDVNNLFETYLGVPRKIKRVEGLIYTFQDAGIGTFNNVVVYSDKVEDSMVFASLLFIFKPRGIFIIKDGYEGWVKNGLPVSKKISYVERGYFSPKISKTLYDSVVWDLNKVLEKMNNYLFVGVSTEKISLIPKSILIKPKFDFDRYVVGSYYNSLDISREKNIILYGVDNYEVLQAYFVLKIYLNYPNVVVFNGGLNEWVLNNLPVNQ